MTGRRGPVSMPDNLRAIRGTNPQRAESHRGVKQVRLAPVAPNPPTALKGEALAEWKRIVPELAAQGLLAKVDRAVITAYCDAWAKRCEASKLLEELGLIVKMFNQENNPVEIRKNPAWQLWRESTNLLAQLGKELLVTPNARLRASMPEGGPDGADEGDSILD